MASEEKQIMVKIVKKASKEAVKCGLIKAGLPDHAASGIADQLLVSYDLVKQAAELTSSSGSVTPYKLAVTLVQKGVGIAKIGSGSRGWQCGVAVAVLGVGILKAGGALLEDFATLGAITPIFLWEAGSLLADAWAMDEKCGVSDRVMAQIDEFALPIYMWFENGVRDIYGIP